MVKQHLSIFLTLVSFFSYQFLVLLRVKILGSIIFFNFDCFHGMSTDFNSYFDTDLIDVTNCT